MIELMLQCKLERGPDHVWTPKKAVGFTLGIDVIEKYLAFTLDLEADLNGYPGWMMTRWRVVLEAPSNDGHLVTIFDESTLPEMVDEGFFALEWFLKIEVPTIHLEGVKEDPDV